MDILDRVICTECRSLQEYDIVSEKSERVWNGTTCTFNKRIAVCRKCGHRVYVPGLDDMNENEFEAKCREENDYILVEEIKEILEKYDVDKRPLSRVLGLGEHTIENYLKGQLPSKRYSDLLRRVLTCYLYMKSFYDSNKDKLNKHAAERLEKKLEFYDQINSHNSAIESVALYILNSKYEITNMSLQKLLYYIEAFAQILLGERIYDDRCEAWTYGPVYPVIYEKYKSFGKSQIVVDDIDLTDCLDESVRKVIDFVLANFAIYNGVTLKDLSHSESPWKNAHAGYGEKEHCEEVISHDAITEYFTSVNEKYDLSSDEGVKNYILSLGVI
jgi:uncharacterized phage-associated protein/DNA-binding transcriptional regulator YiaG